MKCCFNLPPHDSCCLKDHLAKCRISIRSSPTDGISIVVVMPNHVIQRPCIESRV
ncbi:hypothetical protein HanPSC8_Chr17g0798631 [Helianthus annuus]|nr:hypothetical protein HanPSC8_Chr17g0798631 [Helianthus annuus]